MTTEMLTAPSSATVAEVLERLKALSDIDSLYHVYLVDADNRLMGQVLLKRLLLALPRRVPVRLPQASLHARQGQPA